MAEHTPPEFGYIKELKTYADDHWRAWRMEAQLDYQYFREGVPKSEFDLNLGPDSRYVEMRPAKARQLVISATTQLLANPLKFSIDKVVPLSGDQPTMKADREADYAEALLDATVYHTTRKAGNTDSLRASTVSMFITGMGALETGYDEAENPRPGGRKNSLAYQKWLERRPFTFPIFIQSLDPLALWPSPDDGQSWVIKCFERTGWELKTRYPNWKPANEGDPHWRSKKYKFLAYYDHEWCVYGEEGDETAIKSYRHYMGRVPIVIWPSGLGDDNGLPEMRYRGLYTDTRKSKALIALARAMSQVDATNANFAWAQTFYPKKWGTLSFNPGTTVGVAAEAEDIQKGIYMMQGMTAPQGLYTEVDRLERQIHDEVLSEVIGTGQLPASDPTSKSIRRINEAASRLSWCRVYTEQAWERLSQIVLTALRSKDYFGDDEHFTLVAPSQNGKGTARPVNVNREKIPKNPIIRVTISPESDQEKFAKLQAGLAMYTQGPLDPWTLLEDYAGFPDGGQRVMQRKLRQKVLDALTDAAVQTAIARMSGQVPPETGVRDTINAMQQGQQVEQQAAVGQQSGAPTPGSPQEAASMMQEMTSGFNDGSVPMGLRGRQGMRGM